MMIRTFVCIEFPEAERERIAEVAATLRDHRARVSWTASQNVHVTLSFLGDADETRVPDIAGAVERAVAGVAPFRLRIEGTGGFPTLARPRILWAGLDGETAALVGLQARIARELVAIGWPLDERPFKAHVTIGRVKNEREPAVRACAEELERMELHGDEFEVAEVVLMRSDLDPRGVRYTPLARVRLVASV